MDIAVLADIHGNYVALDRCICYAIERGIDTFLFLGDYIGELPYPQKCMTMLYDMKKNYNCTFIRGNKEEYWIDYRKGKNDGYEWEDNNSTTGMLLYAYQHLTDDDINFFESLLISQTIEMENHNPFLICHGSPYKVNEKMVQNSPRTYEIMEELPYELILCGHTHKQYKIIHNNKIVINPGSVGMPIFSDGKTQFLILHCMEHEWKEELISLDYDVDIVIKDMLRENLDIHAPYWNYVTKRLLIEGRISQGTVLSKAMELCRQTTGICVWPHIPEIYWELAVRELYGMS